MFRQNNRQILVIILMLLIRITTLRAQNIESVNQNSKGVIIIVTLNFTDLNCHLCYESFLSICDSLKKSNMINNTWGILLCDQKKRNAEQKAMYRQIIERKLRGFTKANSISFPFVIDYNGEFIRNNDSAINILGMGMKEIKTWELPLQQKKIREIMCLIRK